VRGARRLILYVVSGALALAPAAPAHSQALSTVEIAEALVLARPIPPAQPVDPDPTACCLTGACCRTSGLVVGTAPAFFRFDRSLAIRENTPLFAAPSETNEASKCPAPAIDPPMAVRRIASFYAKSSHFEGCTAAAKTLLTMRTKGGKYTLALKDIAPTKLERDAYAQALSSYGNACLATLASTDTAALLKPTTVAQIQNAVGYFYATPEAPFCTGVVVGGKILTARHCLTMNGSVSINDSARFRTFSGNHDVKISLSATFHDRTVKFDSIADDWIVLDASENVAASSIEVGEPSQWDDLLVPSFDPHRLLLNALGAAGGSGAVVPRLDLSPLCRIAVLDGRFIWHACQTENGFSGSPLLAIDRNERLKVIGLQAGRSQNIRTDCQAALAQFFPNYGISIPLEISAKLKP
jgi:hypothetical protein